MALSLGWIRCDIRFITGAQAVTRGSDSLDVFANTSLSSHQLVGNMWGTRNQVRSQELDTEQEVLYAARADTR